MRKKKMQLAVAAIVLLILVLAGVGVLLARRPAAEKPGSSAVPASSETEEPPASVPESEAVSERAASSQPQRQPVQSTVSEAASLDEEENGESIPASEPASSEAVPYSTAASHEASSSAAHSTAASSHAASSAPTSSSSAESAASDSIASLESFGDPRIDQYVAEIRSLQKRSQRELYQIMSDAYDEYMEYPVEKRTLGLKVSIVLGKTAKLTSMQNQCDKEFKTIIKELRTYLRENGYDQSIADEAEKEYQDKKDAMTKELTSLTYSQVTGSGDGAHWLIEHYDEMMGE